MFEEYQCGCVWSRVQGRVRVCPGHRTVVEAADDGRWIVVRFDPTGKVVRRFPANGEMPLRWNGR